MKAFYRGTVYPWQCDHVGHMNVMWYVGKFDEATWNVFSAIGLTRKYLQQSSRGMAAVDQHLNYHRELLAGDVVRIECTISEIGEKTLTLNQTMYNDGDDARCATCKLIGVHIDLRRRKSVKFGEEILKNMDVLLPSSAAT